MFFLYLAVGGSLDNISTPVLNSVASAFLVLGVCGYVL